VIELSNLIDGLRQDIANLRGQIEVLSNRIDGLDKRQKDLYVDLDTRLRKFEQGQADKDKAAQAAAAEQQAYERGSRSSRRTTTARRSRACSRSSRPTRRARSPVGAVLDRQRALRAARLQERDRRAAEGDRELAESSKAPDALLNIASSQAEAGDPNGSRNTLRTLVSKYPSSPAADQAKQRLAKK